MLSHFCIFGFPDFATLFIMRFCMCLKLVEILFSRRIVLFSLPHRKVGSNLRSCVWGEGPKGGCVFVWLELCRVLRSWEVDIEVGRVRCVWSGVRG
jgi:hypothetical protein